MFSPKLLLLSCAEHEWQLQFCPQSSEHENKPLPRPVTGVQDHAVHGIIHLYPAGAQNPLTGNRSLPESDRIFEGGPLGNYSLAGFEMVLVRHVMHYIINYYLPSGLFVVVSWISFLVPAEVLPGEFVSQHFFPCFVPQSDNPKRRLLTVNN